MLSLPNANSTVFLFVFVFFRAGCKKRRRKDLLFTASEENHKDLFKAASSPSSTVFLDVFGFILLHQRLCVSYSVND